MPVPVPNLSRLLTRLSCFLLLLGSSIAQRPNNASVCDYYAQVKFGANTSETQQNLIRQIVTLAFEGGSRLSRLPPDMTGILRPGVMNGVNIDLSAWFNGSKATTNVNNAAIGINWLDQGGTAPLAAYLAGETQTLVLANSSNQYHLFGNFFFAFSRIFGCTVPFPPLPNTPGAVSPAYAHKFMNLDYNQLGYFIHQLTRASIYYGFSTQDAATIETRLNSQVNVRCAPAIVTNNVPTLSSLCQNQNCPLAAPVSDCAAYENLQPNGANGSSPTTATIVTTATATPTSNASANPIPKTDSGHMSVGTIAGIAIGGAAVLLLAVALLLLFRRKQHTESMPPMSTIGMGDHKDTHTSYYSAGYPASDAAGHAQAGRFSGTASPNVGSPHGYPSPPTFQQHEFFQRPNSSFQEMPQEMPHGGHAEVQHGPVEMGHGTRTPAPELRKPPATTVVN